MARKRNRKPNTGVRYARVPSGLGDTCRFCYMLAARGAVYYSEQTAGKDDHWHAGCRCKIVPSWGTAEIEGYDPKLYSDIWRNWDERKQESAAEGTFTEVAAQVLTRANRSAAVYATLTADEIESLAALVDGNENVIAELYRKHESELRLANRNYKRGAYYSPSQNAVNLDVSEVAAGSHWEKPWSVWFHEFGHQIDHITASGGITRTVSFEKGLGESIKAEAKAIHKAKVAELKAKFTAAAEAKDFEQMHALVGQYFRGDTMMHWAVDDLEREMMRYSSVSFKEMRQFKELTNANAGYKAIQSELRGIDQIARADVSDMFEGATSGKVQAGFGHGKSYWDSDGRKLSTEAFAEMTSAMMTTPESLATIEMYFPKSLELYKQIVGGLL